MHVLDFGTNAFYPHSLLQFSLDCSDEPFGAAPELVVETKPPEQDLDFTIAFHNADSAKRERGDKPLGIGCAGVGTPKIIA